MVFRRSKNAITKVSGFTLIELLIVVSITVILLVTAGFLFGGVLKNSACSSQLNEVNQNGKYVIDMIGRKVRQARQVWIFDGAGYVSPSYNLAAPWTCSGDALKFKCQCADPANCKFAITNPEGNYTGFTFKQAVAPAPGFVSVANGDVLTSLTYGIITNSDLVKGVSLDSPMVAIDYEVGKPLVVGVNFVLSSGIESDQTCGTRAPFQTQVSLRSY